MAGLPILETHTAKTIANPIRLQEYGVTIFSTITTKSALKKVLKKGLILVNGKVATTATYIQSKDTITLLKDTTATSHKKIILPLEVLFEDDHLAIINKPPGILVSGNSFKTIANALEQNLTKSSQQDAVTPKPVHRLDYPTTGVLLIGKTSSSIIALNKRFENKEISKTYIAITIGQMAFKGTITTAIDAKKAITNYQVLKTTVSKRFGALNWVKLTPETGRRHQLRKHLHHINNPILGDSIYTIKDLILKRKGLYLHAYSLEFTHPFTNKKVCFKKEVPEKYNRIFRKK